MLQNIEIGESTRLWKVTKLLLHRSKTETETCSRHTEEPESVGVTDF